MNILIATDGSRQATTAVRTALRLLKPTDRNVDLLCVAPRFSRTLGKRDDYERRILLETSDILARTHAVVGSDAASVRLVPEIGSPASVIVSKAGDYDLTVVGPKGAGETQDAGLGPVASRAVEHAHGPVLVAREIRSEGAMRVLIAVDGSAASLHAVEAFATLFDLADAEVCLLHVVETPWIHLGLQDDWETYDEEDKKSSEAGVFEKEMVREGDEVLERARDILRPYPVSVNTKTEEGTPADEILSETDLGQYDLIVLGATGTRDLKHSMLGSVSAKVAWNAPASVLIVREIE